jgi:hypothetical protein
VDSYFETSKFPLQLGSESKGGVVFNNNNLKTLAAAGGFFAMGIHFPLLLKPEGSNN